MVILLVGTEIIIIPFIEAVTVAVTGQVLPVLRTTNLPPITEQALMAIIITVLLSTIPALINLTIIFSRMKPSTSGSV